MTNVITQLVIKWLLAHLKDVSGSIPWATLKTTIHAKIAAAIPVEFLDTALDSIVDALFDGLAAALSDTTDEALLITDCANQDWPKALSDLQAILAKVLHLSLIHI